MESELFNVFLKIVNNEFPTSISVKIDNKATNLHRQILFIRPDETTVIDDYLLVDNDIIEFSEVNKKSVDLLNKLLIVLDMNLGEKYSKVSKKIYENDKPWKMNKLEEMKTPGLIYVYYINETSNDDILLFMSFMLTEEIGLIETDENKNTSVIYLYEIQLLKAIRGQKLGHFLLSQHLSNCGKKINNEINFIERYSIPFIGIELTVFSDNKRAIKFYESINMKKTPFSPIDSIIKLEKRRTRSQIGVKSLPNLEIIKKPVYYLYYLPVKS